MSDVRGGLACPVAVLLTYPKRFEEGELLERFGHAYLAYKRDTPFIIPRAVPRRHRHRGA